MVRLVCWNMGKRRAPWEELRGSGADVALLQDTSTPPRWALDVAAAPTDDRETAALAGPRMKLTSVVRLSTRVKLRRRATVPLQQVKRDDDAVVSDPGSITAVDVIPRWWQ